MRQTIKILLCFIAITSCSINQKDGKIIQDSKKSIDDIVIDKKVRSNISLQKADNTVLLLLPLSGINSKIGQGILKACLLAAEEYENNVDSLLQKKSVEFCIIDTADNSRDKNNLYWNFKDQNLIAIVGPVFFNEVKTYGALFPEIPIFTFSNNLNINSEHIFSCGIAPQDEIKEILKYINSSEKTNNLLIMLPNSRYGNEILNFIREELKIADFGDRDDIEVIRYDSITRKDATKYAKGAGKNAVFVIDPILNIEKLPGIQVFTLNSSALANEEWSGAIFTFASNDELSIFTEKFRKKFFDAPTTLDIIGYDIVKMIYRTLSNKGLKTFDYLNMINEGCLGNFYFEKNRGIRRTLELLQK
jgi:ABC-type branched-subunit amino acid transport system substrate-binding protein